MDESQEREIHYMDSKCPVDKDAEFIGFRFGAWTAVLSDFQVGKGGKVTNGYWCECLCGETKFLSVTRLRHMPHSRGCSCPWGLNKIKAKGTMGKAEACKKRSTNHHNWLGWIYRRPQGSRAPARQQAYSADALKRLNEARKKKL